MSRGVDDSERIAPFILDEDDIPERFQPSERLYGREPEVRRLLQAFERSVESAHARMVLVEGPSGVGKSRLVNELHKAAIGERTFFISGKVDQYQRNIPYTAIAQAFGRAVLEIWAEAKNRSPSGARASGPR